MKKIVVFICLLIFTFKQGSCQTNDAFIASGNMIIQIINRTIYEIQGNEKKYGMYINRAHLGYRYQFAPKWSGTVILDIGRPTIFGNLGVKDTTGNPLSVSYNYSQGSYYTMTLKFSYLEFNPTPKIKLQAGGILQNHYITQEKFWGYRYILETFSDKYFGIPSADLGFICYFSPIEWLSVDAAITNGEGFRNNQDNHGKVKLAAGIDIKPLKGWITRLYYDNTTSGDPVKPATQQLISIFTGYRLPGVFRLGGEYNWHLNHEYIQNKDLYGCSIYNSIEMRPNLEFLVRYDKLISNTLEGTTSAWHIQDDGEAYIAGVHYKPEKNISLSLSYIGWNPSSHLLKYKNGIEFSFEYKL
ncbi:MAG: hypothetical protein PWR20_1130 [Bacteroidales bacterium]|jgi:hypothetical protein|nr:hypothetical protein [Bacteroidales bacterium]MDN5330177.1 hypothetical protein [Bacteroidales bacterium]